jgi:hypothetical protein
MANAGFFYSDMNGVKLRIGSKGVRGLSHFPSVHINIYPFPRPSLDFWHRWLICPQVLSK